eukprot:297846-Chlamydomonas_euryale.AAC.14
MGHAACQRMHPVQHADGRHAAVTGRSPHACCKSSACFIGSGTVLRLCNSGADSCAGSLRQAFSHSNPHGEIPPAVTAVPQKLQSDLLDHGRSLICWGNQRSLEGRVVMAWLNRRSEATKVPGGILCGLVHTRWCGTNVPASREPTWTFPLRAETRQTTSVLSPCCEMS